jgi:hypothetical protein
MRNGTHVTQTPPLSFISHKMAPSAFKGQIQDVSYFLNFYFHFNILCDLLQREKYKHGLIDNVHET